MTNFTDLAIDSLTMGVLNLAPTTESLAADGAVSIKDGTVLLTKDAILTMTLANPTATTDDYKRLHIMSTTARAHTVAIATTGFGDAGASKVKASFSGVIGDSLDLMAYGGFWYVTGFHQVTFGTA